MVGSRSAGRGRGRGGRERQPPAFPPGRQLFFSRVDTAALLVGEPMHGQPLLTLPPLHGSDASTEVRGDLLPGVQPSLGGMHRVVAVLRGRLVGHEADRIAQTHAKPGPRCVAASIFRVVMDGGAACVPG